MAQVYCQQVGAVAAVPQSHLRLKILSLKLTDLHESVWPSGLRRWLQVPFYLGRRGFEPLSGQKLAYFFLIHEVQSYLLAAWTVMALLWVPLAAKHHRFFALQPACSSGLVPRKLRLARETPATQSINDAAALAQARSQQLRQLKHMKKSANHHDHDCPSCCRCFKFWRDLA